MDPDFLDDQLALMGTENFVNTNTHEEKYQASCAITVIGTYQCENIVLYGSS